MLGSEIISHFLLTIIYFLLVSVFRGRFDVSLVWLWLGAFLGMFLLDLDHIIYWFVTNSEEEDSRQARALFKTKNYKGMYLLLKRVHETHRHLIFHTATFQVVLLILRFYLLTAGGSVLGSALVLSLNLHLLKDEWFDFFGGRKEALKNWLFWQIRDFSAEKYLAPFLVGASILFLILTVIFK